MPRYDAAECQYVLSGQYTLHNPTSGEIQVAGRRQAVAVQNGCWQYGYNFADTEVRVIEWLSFASKPLDCTSRDSNGLTRWVQGESVQSGVLPVPEPELRIDSRLLGRFPAQRRPDSRDIELVEETSALRAILGSESPLLAAVLTSSEQLTVAVTEVPGGRRSDRLQHPSDTVLFVERGKTHVHVPEHNVWAELYDLDVFFVPAGIEYCLLNQTAARSRVLIATTGKEFVN